MSLQTPARPSATRPVAEPPSQDPPAPRAAKDVRFPAVARSSLDNGLRLVVAEHHALPVVYATMVVTAGDAADPKDRPGLAGFVADMLLEGTETRTRQQIVEEIEFLGGEIEAGCSEDRTIVRVSVLRDHLPVALKLLADVVTSPAWPKEAIEKIRDKQLSELQQDLTDPGYLARRTFVEKLYGAGHPYAHVGPSVAALKATTRSDLAAFHKQYFVPGHAFLVVAGDVAPEDITASVVDVFGDWRGSGKTPKVVEPVAPASPTARQIMLVDRPGSVQATFFMGAPSVKRNDPAWIQLVVGNQVLGGSASSRLFLKLREEKSLTYGAYSRLDGRRGVGFAAASANCRNEVVGEAMKEFLAEMHRFGAEPIPDVEMGYAKGYLSGLFPTQVETPANVASMVVQQELFGLPEDYWDTYRSRVLTVGEQEARGLASYLDPERVLVTVVGDATAIEEPLKSFGPVTVVDVDGKKIR